jgi:hypothetical protein
MSDALSLLEVEQQYVELLPARTVLSFACCTASSGATNTSAAPSTGSTPATPTGASGAGGTVSGTANLTAHTIFVFLANNQYNTLTAGSGGAGSTGAATPTGGAATGGAS